MTVVHAFHSAESDEPVSNPVAPRRPTAAHLLDRLLASAEITRREPDRILAALNAARCPECTWPLAIDAAGVSCGRCEWEEVSVNTGGN